MKQIRLAGLILSHFFLFIAPWNLLKCQANCVLQPPLLRIDFGSSSMPADPNVTSIENYHKVNDYCPNDGNYAIVSSTSDCFGSHWITLLKDHTPGGNGGNMMLVNAAYQPGLFFATPLRGLSPNTTYELSVWIVNVCRPMAECTNNRPDLRFLLEDADGKEVAKFSTGRINPTGEASWFQYSAMFTSPAEAGPLLLKIVNKENGGCGNDFAMDDITVRECLMPKPEVKEEAKPKPAIKKPTAVAKPVVKQDIPVSKPADKVIPVFTKNPVKDTVLVQGPSIKGNPAISLPKPILNRANPIVKQIETVASEIVIDLYDNGEIDGDTVSIYHNNTLIVSRAGLSEKPVTFHFAVDAAHPHHELVMVANNLGSIPPNTSLMIITAAGKRYEIFISSSEQKNAKLVIDLKGP